MNRTDGLEVAGKSALLCIQSFPVAITVDNQILQVTPCITIGAPIRITNSSRFFLEPGTPRQRQYEALRAFFVEGVPSAEVARRFGYTPGAFRVLCHAFRSKELPAFFTTAQPGPRSQPK